MAQMELVAQRSRREIFEEFVDLIDGVPWMNKDQGWRIWEHFQRYQPRDVLDIGTCYGTSAAYMAGALEANGGGGQVVTVDSGLFDDQVEVVRWCEALWDRCGVSDAIRPVRIRHSNYAWWLVEQVAERTGADGICRPAYDFAYLDGAKWLTLDGASTVLIASLLRPGGWLLMDDLDWRFSEAQAENMPVVSVGDSSYKLSDAECAVPQLRFVFDHIVRNHPDFTAFIDQGAWGWAQKGSQTAAKVVVRETVPAAMSRSALLRQGMKALLRGPRR